MENITIEYSEEGGWNVIQGDKYSDRLTYDEMLGLVAALTMPDERPCTHWMKTKAQHDLCNKPFDAI